MTIDEIARIRADLGMTQEQLARLLGVHGLTVSRWERGKLRPNPHQEAILRAAEEAARRRPGVGSAVIGALVGAGVGLALFHVLSAAFAGTPRVRGKKRPATL
jgi:transcriptional regulator with XRE-family HTH domain